MYPEKTKIIVGPPGTGKTTKLLDIVEDQLLSDIDPGRICFVAFTRKAANEAKTRAIERLGVDEMGLRYFKTLHALAFQQLGMMRSEVMGFKDYLNIAKMLGLSITFKGGEEGSTFGMEKGDRLLFTENMSRTMEIPLKELWEKRPNEDTDWLELKRLAETLLEYKRINFKYDFTDMIQMFIVKDMGPDIDSLFVDEAQDLSTIQWHMIRILGKRCRKIYIAGDDDQAIFRWAGADVDYFIDLPGDQEVLAKSYRVPENIRKIANDLISTISHRREKQWKPRAGEQGSVEYHMTVEEIDMAEGTWYLLARNRYLLTRYNEYCLQMGYVFDSVVGSPVRGPALGAIRSWEQLRKGNRITIDSARQIYDFMSVKVSVRYGSKGKIEAEKGDRIVSMEVLRTEFGLATDKIWHRALDRLTDTEREYFISALRRGEKLLKEPRIKVNTIHSVKGGEADHVVFFTDMALRTWDEYQENPDDEARVWYVAATRARHSLHIVNPSSNRYFDI